MDLIKLEQQFEPFQKGQRLIIRDDLYDTSELQQIFEIAAKKKIKIYLIDTGRLSSESLEQFPDYRFSFYTSDVSRPEFQELIQLKRILKPKGCPLYYLIQGDLEDDSQLFNHLELFDSVIISSREKPRALKLLARLAEEITHSRSSFVYYHHKNLEENLADVGLKKCWIHVSNKYLEEQAEIMIMDLIKTIRKNKGHIVIHVDRLQPYPFLKTLVQGGAFLVFSLPPLEPSSNLFLLAETLRKKTLPEKSYYLYKEIMV